jgi:hypothetical protein
MLLYAGSALLVGFLLAARFRVFILIPATALALVGGIAINHFQTHSIAGGQLLAAVCLQMGYLGGGLGGFASRIVGFKNARRRASPEALRGRFT